MKTPTNVKAHRRRVPGTNHTTRVREHRRRYRGKVSPHPPEWHKGKPLPQGGFWWTCPECGEMSNQDDEFSPLCPHCSYLDEPEESMPGFSDEMIRNGTFRKVRGLETKAGSRYAYLRKWGLSDFEAQKMIYLEDGLDHSDDHPDQGRGAKRALEKELLSLKKRMVAPHHDDWIRYGAQYIRADKVVDRTDCPHCAGTGYFGRSGVGTDGILQESRHICWKCMRTGKKAETKRRAKQERSLGDR